MSRAQRRLAGALAIVASWPLAAAAAHRPKPDLEAIREATGSSGEVTERYVSARALSHYMQAVLARSNGDETTALAELRLAALYDAENAYPQYVLANEYRRMGDLKAAWTAVQSALVVDPNHAPSWTLLGRLELDRGESDRALVALHHAIAAAPEAIEAAVLSVDALLSRGDTARASAVAARLAVRIRGESPAAERHVVAGVLDRVASVDVAQAETLLKRAVDVEPENLDRLLALARYYELRADQPLSAAAVYARAVGLSVDDPRFTLDAARLYLKAGRRAEAAAYIAHLAACRDGTRPLVRLGDMLLEAGAKDDALRAYDTACDLMPGWGEPLFKAADLLERQARFPAAAALYRRVSSADEQYGRAQARAGVCDLNVLQAAGKVHEAIALARSLANRDPPEGDALNYLATTVVAQGGDLDEAESDARAAVARWPERDDYLHTLGIVLLARGRPDAFAVLEKAAAALPDHPAVQLDLAEAAIRAAHPDAARVALSRVDALLVRATDKTARQRATHLRQRLAGIEVPDNGSATLHASESGH